MMVNEFAKIAVDVEPDDMRGRRLYLIQAIKPV